MLRQFMKYIRWFCSCGIVMWFVVTPLLPIYGWLSPWPSANERLEEEGIVGLQLMIGARKTSERVGDNWKEETQRSFIVLPDSLRQMEIITYQELRGSDISGVKKEVVRSHWLVPFFVLWILAGAFSKKIALPWMKNKNPKAASLDR